MGRFCLEARVGKLNQVKKRGKGRGRGIYSRSVGCHSDRDTFPRIAAVYLRDYFRRDNKQRKNFKV